MRCSHCGSALPDGAVCCPICGRPAALAGQEKPAGAERSPAPERAGEGAALFREILSRPGPPPEEPSPAAPAPPEGEGTPHRQDGTEGSNPVDSISSGQEDSSQISSGQEDSEPAGGGGTGHPPARPARRRWLPVALGCGGVVLLAAAALIIRFVLLGGSQPVFYLSQNTLYYCYNPDTAPTALLEEVDGGVVALTSDGKSAVLLIPDGTGNTLYWLTLGRDGGALTQVDAGLSGDLVPMDRNSITPLTRAEYDGFYLDESGVLFYQKPTRAGSRRNDLYRCDGGAPQLLKENVGRILDCSPDGTALLVEQYGENRGLVRRSAQPGGEEDLICAGEDIRVIWSDSDGFSQILYTTGDVFFASAGGDGLALYRWTPGEGSQVLLSDISQVVRAEGPESIYYTRGNPDQLAQIDVGGYVVSKPVSALYHWQAGTDTLLCGEIFQFNQMKAGLLLYWPYTPGMSDLGAPLIVHPVGGEPVTLEGLWGGAAVDDNGTLYGLEQGGTLVRYTRAGGYADRTELATEVAVYVLNGDRLYFSTYTSGALEVYRLEGEKAVPVVGAVDGAFQAGVYRDGAALIDVDGAVLQSWFDTDAEQDALLSGETIYQSPGGARTSLGGEVQQVQRLEGDDLLVLSGREGELILYRDGKPIPLAQGVDSFCAPSGQRPFYTF